MTGMPPATRAGLRPLGPVVDQMRSRAQFVLGFLFNSAGERVALITKQRPSWQAGALNGLGGRVNPGEKPLDAMNREFREEAGVFVGLWERFAELQGHDFEVIVFRAFSDATLDSVRTMTDEPVEVLWVWDALAGPRPVIAGITWLIPLALHRGQSDPAGGPRLVQAVYDAALKHDLTNQQEIK